MFHEPVVTSRVAGQLLGLLKCSVTGDVEAKLAPTSLASSSVNNGLATPHIQPNMKVGIVLRQLDSPKLHEEKCQCRLGNLHV